MSRRTLSSAEINNMINRMMDPNLSTERLLDLMEDTSRKVQASNWNATLNKHAAHRQEVRKASANNDLAALRKLANKNLSQRK